MEHTHTLRQAKTPVYKMAEWISYHPKTVILIAALLLIPSAIGYFCTGVNYDILTYLPEKLESVQGEVILDESFNNASSSFIVAKDLSDKEVVRLQQKIEAVDGVYSVTSVHSIADASIPKEILPDVLTSIFYSEDGSSTLLMVQYIESGSSQRTMSAIREIRTIMNADSFLSGLSAITVDTKDLADSQAPIYIAIAIALALIVLSFTMNSVVLPFVLLTALCVAVVYNMGTNILFGEISYITQCIAAILQLGVTMDYSVFLMDRYEEERLKYSGDNKKAMSYAITTTFTSLAGSSLTTVFGFLALCFMQFTLGIDIGLVMAKGVLFGVLTVVTFLPALILVLTKWIDKTRHKSLVPSFKHLSGFTVKHRRILAIIFVLLFIPAYIVQSNLKVYYDMTKALPKDLSSVSSLEVLKDEFDMATTHFVICDADLKSSDTTAMVSEIEKVDGVNKVLALSSFVGPAIPMSILPDEIKDICVAETKDGKTVQLMMINSEYSGATDEENAQIDQIKSVVKKYDSSAYLTGEGVLEKDLIEVTNRDFMVTSIISIAAIFVLIAICLQSVSLPVILVMAIELAILLNKACSVVLGSTVPFIGPTVIGCVQLGATVDYAILLASRFKEEMQKGSDRITAMKTSAMSASRSIYQSALVFFAATFGVYIVCDISIVKSICGMLARGSIISAFVIMVFVVPALVCCESLIHKTTLYWRKPKPVKEKAEYEITAARTAEAINTVNKKTAKKENRLKGKGNPDNPAPPPMKKQISEDNTENGGKSK